MSSPRNFWLRYRTLVTAVNRSASGYSVRVDSALRQEAYERKLQQGVFHFVLVEPHRVLDAEHQDYRVFARAGRANRTSGVIVTRTSAPIYRVRDLRAKTICFGAEDALASTMLSRMWLREANFDERSASLLFTGSDETALFRLWRGLADAAAVSRANFERFIADYPSASATLKVKWQTGDLSGVAVMAHQRVPTAHVRQLAAALSHLDESEDGRHALSDAGVRSFRLGDAASYDDVWEFLNTYARHFGPHPRGVRP